MYERILVPVDGSDTSNCGLDEAIRLAKSLGSTLRLVHVVNEFILDGTYSPGLYGTDLFESLRNVGSSILEQARAAAAQAGVKSEAVLLESIGAPAGDLIVAQAGQWPADLIVMGTHGRRGLARLVMGSDAEHVLRASFAPVLLVRATAAATGAKRKAEPHEKTLV